ncbi:sugar phosphate isomerase/epimerase family protein [Micromonospora sp. NPDC051141]|uniref:sugar phosphate isomerase/epimerase family protein n=1 Tax=Micromonospora sp. NPDC051141 TaxID=3364284 RepID=UPI0037B03CD0
MTCQVGVQMGTRGYGIMGSLPVRDLPKSLEYVRSAGATGVEVMTNLIDDPHRLRTACSDAGLEIIGLHVFWSELDDALLAKVRELEVPRLICSGVPVSSPAECDSSIETIRNWSASARQAGATFLVHNHEEECAPFPDGRLPIQVIAERTTPEDVAFVVDVYWANRAGADFDALFAALTGRCDFVHFKDGLRAGDAATKSYGLGEGEVDLERAWSAATAAGPLAWAVVERDNPAEDPEGAVLADVHRLRAYAGHPSAGADQ